LGKMVFESVMPRQRATSGCFDGACLGDLTTTLMLLKFCGRCFAGTPPPSSIPNGAGLRRRRWEWVTLGAERVKGPKGATRRVRSGSWLKAVCAGRLGSTLRPSHGPVQHRRRDASGGPWLRRDGAMTRGHNKRVKGRCTKQRQGAQRVKAVWPCEYTLEACTTRGVTVMPL
jgi:hypothetical protein